MTVEGTNIACADQSSGRSGRSNIAHAISQLIVFNSPRFSSGSSNTVRHSEGKETPLPNYVGLVIHTMTRKRDIIDKLHRLGLSISYDHVLQLSTDLANAVCQQYEGNDIRSLSTWFEKECIYHFSS